VARVTLKNVVKRFGSFTALDNVSLDIADREFVVFVGPSGCGKSTLLRTIAGLEDVTDGRVFIADEEVTWLEPADRKVAMVFQNYALYPHMTVAQNMAFGLRMAKVPRAERDEPVRKAARILQIEELLHRRPRELSGGQRQRVAIGRAIVREPRVFLFDEPLSNLDAALRVQMRVELTRLHRELDVTMVYVTHDQVEAMTMADRIVVLNKGIVEQVGSPRELYHHPVNMFVAGFIGSPQMNFVDATVARADASGVAVTLPGGAQLVLPRQAGHLSAGAAAKLGVRPESFVERPEGGGPDGAGPEGAGPAVAGRVLVSEELGSDTHIHLVLDNDQVVIVRAPGDTHAEPDSRRSFGIEAAECHLFDTDGKALPALDRAYA